MSLAQREVTDLVWSQFLSVESAEPHRTAKSKNNPFFFTALFAVLHSRYFQHRFGQKKLVENSMFAIRFLFFLMFFWSSADSIRKWSCANPALVFCCICSARRNSSGRVPSTVKTVAVFHPDGITNMIYSFPLREIRPKAVDAQIT